MTGRGFRCGGGEIGRNASVILPAEHVSNVSRRYISREASCDKVAQRRQATGNQTNNATRRRRNAPTSGSLTLSSPTALLSSAPEWQAQFYKTKLCPFFVRDIPDAASAQQAAAQLGHNVGSASGVCMNRDACRFAHSFEELRPLPDLRKTKLCSSYTKKTPCKNPKCPFAHSPGELRTSSSVFYKVTLCNFYKNGRCWNGANCRFAHGNDELRTTSTAETTHDPSSSSFELEDEDELISNTTTSTRPKKARRPLPREKSDGLLPTPAESTRLPFEKAVPPQKPRTAVTTTSNSATTTPPGSAVQPSASFPDTETLISLVTQKLLEPVADAPQPVSQLGGPPGFPEMPSSSPSSLNLDTETLVSLLLAAANSKANPSPVEEPYLRSHDVFPDSYYNVPEVGNITHSHAPENPSAMAVPFEPSQSVGPESADDATVRLLMSLLQGISIDEQQPFV